MKRAELKNILNRYKQRIETDFYVKEIGFFGSYVRGEEGTHSDIDILVSFQKGHKDFFNYMRLKSYLENVFGREVDLVIRDAIKHRLRPRILNEVEYV